MPKESPKTQLGLLSAMSVVIGCAIGSGVFVKPARVLMATEDSNLAILAWVLGGLISIAGGLTVAEIGARIPKTGGVYTYMEEIFGPAWGFICGWVQTLLYAPGLLGAIGLYFSSLLCKFLGLEIPFVKPIALLAVLFLSVLSAVGTHYSVWIQNFTTIIKLFPIVLIGGVGLFMGSQPIFGVSTHVEGAALAGGLGMGILSTLWAYDGWMGVANLAGEMKNAVKNLPRAIIFGLLIVMGSYVLVNVSLFSVLDKFQLIQLGENAAGEVAKTLFGTFAGTLLSLVIVVSIFGTLNGNILAMTRVPYAMAVRGAFPFRSKFSELHPKFGTPFYSVFLNVACSWVMMMLWDPDRITDLAIFSMYLFYTIVFFGLFVLRKRQGANTENPSGGYRVPLYPVIPICAIAGCLYISWSMIQQAPWDAMISIGIALYGYPVYKFLNAREAHQTSTN